MSKAMRQMPERSGRVGVAHPSPTKAKEFVSIDQKSAMEAIQAASQSGVKHFVYVSVAHPAPVMHAFIAVRTACEEALRAACARGTMNATILRPWYILGPGHWWPYVLVPVLCILERIPSTGESARRLGFELGKATIEAEGRCAACAGG